MRALALLAMVLVMDPVPAQGPLLLTTLPRADAEGIADRLALRGLSIRVETLGENLQARLARDPEPAVLYAIDGFALVELLEAGRLQPLPDALGDRLEPFWSDRGHHVLVTLAEPWVLAYDQTAWRSEAVPTDFDAFVDPSFTGNLTLPTPRSAPSLWMAWIQDQSRQGYSEDRAFAWLGSVDARVQSYRDSSASCLAELGAGHADISVLPLGQALARQGFGAALGYRLPQHGIPLRGLGLAALVEVDAEIRELCDYLLEAEPALRLARERHLLPCPRRGLATQDLPPVLQPIRDRAMPYLPLSGDLDAWFTRWEEQVQGRGRDAEWLDDWLDVGFGAIFLGLVVFIFTRTRHIDE